MTTLPSLTNGYYGAQNNNTSKSNCGFNQNETDIDNLTTLLTTSFTLLVCLFGVMGNGMVIWLLGFHIEKNHFNKYILNLSVADLGVVMSVIAINLYWLAAKSESIEYSDPLKSILRTFFLFVYSSSQFLLTVISIDRCVCVFFPFWYRWYRPPNLSTIVCAIIWILTFLLSATHIILFQSIGYFCLRYYHYLLNALFFTPIMCISTVALFVKVCLISPQQKREVLLTSIVITLLFFVLFGLPMNIIQCLSLYVHHAHNFYFLEYASISASLHGTVNPIIYFLVGNEKGSRFRKRMQRILERVFKEEEESRESRTPSSVPNMTLP